MRRYVVERVMLCACSAFCKRSGGLADSQTVSEIQRYYKREEFGSYVVDPHTAVGLAAQARSQKKAYVCSLNPLLPRMVC